MKSSIQSERDSINSLGKPLLDSQSTTAVTKSSKAVGKKIKNPFIKSMQ